MISISVFVVGWMLSRTLAQQHSDIAAWVDSAGRKFDNEMDEIRSKLDEMHGAIDDSKESIVNAVDAAAPDSNSSDSTSLDFPGF